MGRIVKYNVSKGASSRTQTPSTTVSSGYPTNTGGATTSTSCNFWGNDWHGYEDLTGSMLINGDVTIDYDVDDEDNDTYDEEEGDEQPTGSLYVSGNVEANSTYGKTVYLNYPEVTSTKQNLAPLLKGFDSRITTNSTNITNLQGRVSSCETNITNLQGRVSSCETNITNINTNIGNLSNRMSTAESNIASNRERILALESGGSMTEARFLEILDQYYKYGAYTRPVVLMTGNLQRNTINSSWYYSGTGLQCFKDITCSVELGLMTIDLTPNTDLGIDRVVITTVMCTQYSSQKTEDITKGQYVERGVGAHWFESRYQNDFNYKTNKIFVREFHQGNGDNDTWATNQWSNLNNVNIVVFGYCQMNQ